MKILDGKVAIITGASRGIGKQIAIQFAKEGADIAFSSSAYNENAKSVESELKTLGVKAKAYPSDAGDFDSAQEFVEKVIKDFGKVDILVNNAGITRDTLLMRMTEEQWDLVLKVNLKSVFNLTKAVQKYMLKQRYGSIINMTSVVGIRGNAGQANYSASKAGMIGFTKSIAIELGSRNIRCNAIAPGFIETEMTEQIPEVEKENWIKSIPLRRVGKAQEVANAAVFLASDLSSYISGQVLNVCGAMLT